jgi:ligand-binding sensor domain-containing protein/serine phosphatase RsbU (regulator of sigma subunit)
VKITVRKYLLFLIPFWLFISVGVVAQQLNIRNYTVEDGLPVSNVLGLFQDSKGYVWIASNGGGVCRYDGLDFKTYTSNEGLSSDQVFCVYENAQKELWFGTVKGLTRYYNRKVIAIDETLINQLSVYTIFEDTQHKLWLGTNNGIVIYDGKNFKPFEKNNEISGYQIVSIDQDRLGNVWFATLNNGVYCYDGTRLMNYGFAAGLPDLMCKHVRIYNDRVYVSHTKGLSVLEIGNNPIEFQKFESFKLNGKPFNEATESVFFDTDGFMWIGSSSGVIKVNYNNITWIKKSNGLCNNLINTIIQDKEGEMWFGSLNGGISKFQSNLFTRINEQNGLTFNKVTHFFKDRKDRLWISTWGGGISLLDYKSWIRKDTVIIKNIVQQKDGLTSNTISSVTEDNRGNIWIATYGAGVCEYNGKVFTTYDVRSGLHGEKTNAIVADKHGNVWIGNENGLDRFDGNNFTFYGKQFGFSSNGVNAIYDDEIGNVWFASHTKIVKFDGRQFSSIVRKEGFSHINCIAKDKFGYMWFGSDAGIYVYNGKTFKTITEADGLSSNFVSSIVADDNGSIWLGTNKGLDKLDLDKYTNLKELSFKHFDKEDGLAGLEMFPGASYKDVNGNIWIGSYSGITVANTNNYKTNKVAPQLHLTAIRFFLGNEDIAEYSDSLFDGIPMNLQLPYDKNYITFEYVGISHKNSEKVKYQFKLEGAENNWSPEITETSQTFLNLAPGNYKFMLRAANADGLWSVEPMVYSFEIVPPFYKQAWFYILVIVSIASLIYLVIKLRERTLKYSQRLLERQVNLRTKELIEEKEKLQAAYSEIDEKNKDITDSMLYARRLQSALLPTDTTRKQFLPESFVMFKPKDIVSGDFYWIEQWGHQTLVAAADCTGHGVPGAFMSIVGHNILTQTVNVLGLSRPALILNETNKQLSRKLNQNPEEATVRDGMDIALVSINYTKGKMEFAGANNPVWIVRNDDVIEINGNKFPIGAFVGEEIQKFTNHEWDLISGDCVYVFTDGYADQFGGPKGKKFKYKPLQQLLIDIHKKPMSEQKEILEKNIDDWKGSLEQIDDMLIIGFKV